MQCPQDEYLSSRYERAFFDVFFSSAPIRVDFLENTWGVTEFGFYFACMQIAEHFHISPQEASEMDTWWFELSARYIAAKAKNEKRLADIQASKARNRKR